MNDQTQFRSLFHWGFRMFPGIQDEPPPSAVPPFPVLMARNLRPAGVAVDVFQLWASPRGNGGRGPTALLIRPRISQQRNGLDGDFFSQPHPATRHVEIFLFMFYPNGRDG